MNLYSCSIVTGQKRAEVGVYLRKQAIEARLDGEVGNARLLSKLSEFM